MHTYIHIPFCKQKCAYCDFNSFPGMQSIYREYVDSLCREISAVAPSLGDLDMQTLYIGGGTPTVLGLSLIEKLLDTVHASFKVCSDTEITIEANPDTVDIVLLRGLSGIGINRLSFGVQSLDDNFLTLLGRTHTSQQAVDAYRAAREAGFANVNLDLIFGLPEQSLAQWMFTLEQAVALGPEHLSCYGLSVEPGTGLASSIDRGDLPLPDQDIQADMLVYTMESLGDSGYEHYEISNYARPGRESRHNLAYWNNADYIGFGAGAHSKLHDKRYCNVTDPKEYIETAGTEAVVAETIRLSKEDMLSDEMILGLRKIQGIDIQEVAHKYEVDIYKRFERQIKSLSELNLVSYSGNRLRLTQKGILLGNEVFNKFV